MTEDKQEYQFYDLLREQNVTGASAKPIENNVQNKPDAVIIQKKSAQSPQVPDESKVEDEKSSLPVAELLSNDEVTNSKTQPEGQINKEKAKQKP